MQLTYRISVAFSLKPYILGWGEQEVYYPPGTLVIRTMPVQKVKKIVFAFYSLPDYLSCSLRESSQIADSKTQSSLSSKDSSGIVCTVWIVPEEEKKEEK